MGEKRSSSRCALLLSTALLVGLMVVSTLPVGAQEEEEDQSGIGMDALAGLAADDGGGTSDPASSGNLDDPLAGDADGSSEETDTETRAAPLGTTDGSDPTASAAASANPMFELMLDLILEDVQAAEAEVRAGGKTLTEAQRSRIAARSVQDLIAFLQETGILRDVDTRGLAERIGAIPTEPEE